MEIIPSISIMNGKVVVVEGGRYKAALDGSGGPFDPCELSEALFEQFGKVFVLDLNGLEKNKPQISVIKAMAGSADIWLDAGARSAEALIDMLVSGAESVVLNLKHIKSEAELSEANEMLDSLIIGAEYDMGLVCPISGFSGAGVPEAAERIKKAGFDRALFIDAKSGGGALSIGAFSSMPGGISAYVGIPGADEEKLREFDAAGISGVMVGLSSLIKMKKV